MSVAENIKRIRKDMGLTQKELAEMADIAVITLQQYELGKRMPRKQQLEKLAAALHVHEDQLLISNAGTDIFAELLALAGWEITSLSECDKNSECPLSKSEYAEKIRGSKNLDVCARCDYPNKRYYYISNGKMYYKIEGTDLDTLENCIKPYLELRIQEIIAKKEGLTTREFLRREYGEK